MLGRSLLAISITAAFVQDHVFRGSRTRSHFVPSSSPMSFYLAALALAATLVAAPAEARPMSLAMGATEQNLVEPLERLDMPTRRLHMRTLLHTPAPCELRSPAFRLQMRACVHCTSGRCPSRSCSTCAFICFALADGMHTNAVGLLHRVWLN